MLTVEQRYLLKQFRFKNKEDLVYQLQDAKTNSEPEEKAFITDILHILETDIGYDECVKAYASPSSLE